MALRKALEPAAPSRRERSRLSCR